MADPKKGTGKKPKGSGRRLYTDENPRDTVRIKFATPADAKRKYPKCVPLAKARRMSEGQRRSAVKRKMGLFQNVEDQNKKQIQNVNIQNASHLQKPHE